MRTATMRATSRIAGALAFATLLAAGAQAQTLPTFEQYPLRDRVFGPGGAFFPDYVTPYERGIAYMTGGGTSRHDVFAAGTTDFNCQQTQVPDITVLSAPSRGTVKVRYGSFLATGTDGGATNPCLGHTLKGMVVSYKGRAAPGEMIRLRVTYPTLGAWYDHVVPVPTR